MSKLFRFFIVATLLAFAYWSAHPSIVYYFFTDQDAIDKIELTEKELNELPEEDKKAIQKAQMHQNQALNFGLDLRGGIKLVIEVDYHKLAEITERDFEDITLEEKEDHINKIVRKIKTRVDTYGISEITIRKQSETRLTIQIPGETSSDRILNLIETTGKLEFLIVADDNVQQQIKYDEDSNLILNEDELRRQGYKILFRYEKNSEGELEQSSPVALLTNGISGENIKNASDGYDYNGLSGFMISFELNDKGTKEFAQLTSANVGKPLAIILDDRVLQSPNIKQPITGGSGQISGNFSSEEAKDIALILKSGSLSAPIKVISKDIIAPTLGVELRDKGLKALVYGLLVVMVLIIIIYRFFGLISALALAINGFMVISFLCGFKLTLSLSSIAGLILTIGMSIDANVIIFERIKEELRLKKSLVDAIYIGYEKGFWSIFDANVTTILATFVLYYYGSGALQGFATTLFFGILVSMITSLFITRLVFDTLISYQILRKKHFLII